MGSNVYSSELHCLVLSEISIQRGLNRLSQVKKNVCTAAQNHGNKNAKLYSAITLFSCS